MDWAWARDILLRKLVLFCNRVLHSVYSGWIFLPKSENWWSKINLELSVCTLSSICEGVASKYRQSIENHHHHHHHRTAADARHRQKSIESNLVNYENVCVPLLTFSIYILCITSLADFNGVRTCVSHKWHRLTCT